jgi:hypothetical protein
MNPFELVLSRLPDARPVPGASQKAWKARCPAHADSDPSLSITLADKGGALIHCYAGCSPEAVVEALGLTMADLMPPRHDNGPRATGHGPLKPDTDSHGLTRIAAKQQSQKTGAVYATSDEAVAELERRMGPASQTWTYHDDCEDAAGLILRWDREGGKEIRPVSRTRAGWVLGGMPTPRPLYRLVELLTRRDERVYVTEGEKAADAAGTLGLLATTSPHGAQSAAKADWRPLAGRDVAILPDNDDAGRRYADDVAQILLGLEPPATVRIVALPEIDAGQDIHDWLEHRDAVEPHTLRERLEKLVEATAVRNVPVRAYLPDDRTQQEQEKITPHGVTTNQSRITSHESRSCVPLLTCVDDVQETAIRWLWPGRVPLGRITMLVGRPGEGKSFLTTDMAARVTRGLSWPDGTDCPDGSVLVISAEDDPRDTIRPRLRAHGADLKRVHLFSMVRRPDAEGRPYETMFTLADVEALDAALTSHPDCRLVVVDPIGSFLGGGTDAHRDNDVRSVLVPVTVLAERHNVAVLVVAHRRKSFGPNADDMALGSRAFTAVARAVWHLTRDPENKARRLLLTGKSNIAAEQAGLAFTIVSEPGGLPSIAWEPGPIDMTADQAMQRENEAGSEPGRTALQKATTWLQAALADGPLPSAEVTSLAVARGVSERTLQRAKESLGVRAFRKGSGGGAVWYCSLSVSCDPSQTQNGREDQPLLAGCPT